MASPWEDNLRKLSYYEKEILTADSNGTYEAANGVWVEVNEVRVVSIATFALGGFQISASSNVQNGRPCLRPQPRLGHPLRPPFWLVIRQLFVSPTSENTETRNNQEKVFWMFRIVESTKSGARVAEKVLSSIYRNLATRKSWTCQI